MYHSAQDIAAGRAHKTISGADVLKALEALHFGEFVPMFQGDLEGKPLLYISLIMFPQLLSVFRQGYKNRTKAATDSKSKGSDSPIGTVTKSASTRMSATSPSAPPAATSVPPTENPQEPQMIAQNGVSVVDVEMRDASEEGTEHHEVKVLLPIE